MDETDVLSVRIIVMLVAMLATWYLIRIWREATRIRHGAAGQMLRARAILFLSYCVNLSLMSFVLIFDIISRNAEIIWRQVTRLHAAFLVLAVALDILHYERQRHE